VDAPTFCHGQAGLLQITLRMANETGSERLVSSASGLAVELVDRFEPDSTLGYRDLDPDGRSIDCPGLLIGAAGISLVLLAAASDVVPDWDRVFLLA
jgi:lantibiotic modifying enzyme